MTFQNMPAIEYGLGLQTIEDVAALASFVFVSASHLIQLSR